MFNNIIFAYQQRYDSINISEQENFQNREAMYDRESMLKVAFYYVAFIVVVGFITNILSMIVFLVTPHTRKMVCTAYLVCQCVANLFSLLALSMTWFGWLEMMSVSLTNVCKLRHYISGCTGYVSVWVVTCLSIERYVVLSCPLNYQLIFTHGSTKRFLGCLTVFSMLYYMYCLWTYDGQMVSGYSILLDSCFTLIKHRFLITIMEILDAMFGVSVPLFIIVNFNVPTVHKLYKLSHGTSLSYQNQPRHSTDSSLASFFIKHSYPSYDQLVIEHSRSPVKLNNHEAVESAVPHSTEGKSELEIQTSMSIVNEQFDKADGLIIRRQSEAFAESKVGRNVTTKMYIKSLMHSAHQSMNATASIPLYNHISHFKMRLGRSHSAPHKTVRRMESLKEIDEYLYATETLEDNQSTSLPALLNIEDDNASSNNNNSKLMIEDDSMSSVHCTLISEEGSGSSMHSVLTMDENGSMSSMHCGLTIEDDSKSNSTSVTATTDDDHQKSSMFSTTTTIVDNQMSRELAVETTDDDNQMNSVLATETTDDDNQMNSMCATETTDDDNQMNNVFATETTDDDNQINSMCATETTDDDNKMNSVLATATTDDDNQMNGMFATETTDDDNKMSRMLTTESTDDDNQMNCMFATETTDDENKISRVLATENIDDDNQMKGMFATETTDDDNQMNDMFATEATADNNQMRSMLDIETIDDENGDIDGVIDCEGSQDNVCGHYANPKKSLTSGGQADANSLLSCMLHLMGARFTLSQGGTTQQMVDAYMEQSSPLDSDVEYTEHEDDTHDEVTMLGDVNPTSEDGVQQNTPRFSTTIIILITTAVFFLCVFPARMLKIYLVLSSFTDKDNGSPVTITVHIQKINDILQLMAYVPLVTNFFVYVALSNSFRKTLSGCFRKIFSKLY